MKILDVLRSCHSLLTESPLSDLKDAYKRQGVEFTEELKQAFAGYKEIQDKEQVKPHVYKNNPQGFIDAVNKVLTSQRAKVRNKRSVKTLQEQYVKVYDCPKFEVYAINTQSANMRACFTIGRKTKEEQHIGDAQHEEYKGSVEEQLAELANDDVFFTPSWCIASKTYGVKFWRDYKLGEGETPRCLLFISKEHQNWRFQVTVNENGSIHEVRDPWQSGGFDDVVGRGLSLLTKAYEITVDDFDRIVKECVSDERAIENRAEIQKLSKRWEEVLTVMIPNGRFDEVLKMLETGDITLAAPMLPPEKTERKIFEEILNERTLKFGESRDMTTFCVNHSADSGAGLHVLEKALAFASADPDVLQKVVDLGGDFNPIDYDLARVFAMNGNLDSFVWLLNNRKSNGITPFDSSSFEELRLILIHGKGENSYDGGDRKRSKILAWCLENVDGFKKQLLSEQVLQSQSTENILFDATNFDAPFVHEILFDLILKEQPEFFLKTCSRVYENTDGKLKLQYNIILPKYGDKKKNPYNKSFIEYFWYGDLDDSAQYYISIIGKLTAAGITLSKFKPAIQQRFMHEVCCNYGSILRLRGGLGITTSILEQGFVDIPKSKKAAYVLPKIAEIFTQLYTEQIHQDHDVTGDMQKIIAFLDEVGININDTFTFKNGAKESKKGNVADYIVSMMEDVMMKRSKKTYISISPVIMFIRYFGLKLSEQQCSFLAKHRVPDIMDQAIKFDVFEEFELEQLKIMLQGYLDICRAIYETNSQQRFGEGLNLFTMILKLMSECFYDSGYRQHLEAWKPFFAELIKIGYKPVASEVKNIIEEVVRDIKSGVIKESEWRADFTDAPFADTMVIFFTEIANQLGVKIDA